MNQSTRINQPNTTTHSGLPDHNQPLLATGGNKQQLLSIAGNDSRQLKEHEAALQRLEELQKTMIGGERAGDSDLQQELLERKKKAEDRRELLLRASRSADEDDGIIEGIFNSLTGMNYYNTSHFFSPVFIFFILDEVRVKSRALERCQMKLKSAQEDVADLQTEFELERQGYLDTIRNQV